MNGNLYFEIITTVKLDVQDAEDQEIGHLNELFKLSMRKNYRLTPEHINKGKESRFYIRCLECNVEDETTVLSNVIQQCPCHNCSNTEKGNHDKLLRRIKLCTFFDNFDYSLIKPEIPLICKSCNSCWNTSVDGHFNM